MTSGTGKQVNLPNPLDAHLRRIDRSGKWLDQNGLAATVNYCLGQIIGIRIGKKQP
jgi:hypothetical protein